MNELQELLEEMNKLSEQVSDIIREDIQDDKYGARDCILRKFNEIEWQITELVDDFNFDNLNYKPTCKTCGEKFPQMYYRSGKSMEYTECLDCNFFESPKEE